MTTPKWTEIEWASISDGLNVEGEASSEEETDQHSAEESMSSLASTEPPAETASPDQTGVTHLRCAALYQA